MSHRSALIWQRRRGGAPSLTMLCVLSTGVASSPTANTLDGLALQAPDDAAAQPGSASVSLYVGKAVHECRVLPHPEGPSALEREAQALRSRAIAAARTTSLRSQKKHAPIICAKTRSEVAVIIAADIRLPPEVLPKEWIDTVAFRHAIKFTHSCSRGFGPRGSGWPSQYQAQLFPPLSAPRHRGGTKDGCTRTRGQVVAAINRFTEGSDLFIHTDQAYASTPEKDRPPEAAPFQSAHACCSKGHGQFDGTVPSTRRYSSDISLFEHVVASRFAEEDGGNPSTANKGNRGGLYVQWWRLSRAWALLVEYEQKCAAQHDAQECASLALPPVRVSYAG